MAKKAKFDLPSFQSEVIEAYNFLKTMDREARESGLDRTFRRMDGKAGCLGQFFRYPVVFKGLRAMEKKAVDSYFQSADLIERTRRSKKIVFDERIKAILCPRIGEKIEPGTLTEETELALIRIVTSSLTTDETVKEHSIELDPYLFAHMVKHIMQQGVGSYCATNAPEEAS